MADQQLDYAALVQVALLEVVRMALRTVADTGLPEGHELFLTFRTDHPGIDLPDYLREAYPEELTIALKRSFWDLSVGVDRFSVVLVFSGARTPIVVPFAALKSFVDPPVQFALTFEPRVHEPEPPPDDNPDSDVSAEPADDRGNVVRFERRPRR